MAGGITVKIKRQLFDPPFVIQIGDEEVSARIGRLDDNSVVASIENRGIYKIDMTGVGFWFVEKKAQPYRPDRILSEIHGGILERMLTAVARSLGEDCGAAVAELQGIQNYFVRLVDWYGKLVYRVRDES